MEIVLCAVIFQTVIAVFPEPVRAFLGVNPPLGVVTVNAVPDHESLDACFLRGSDGDGYVAQFHKAPFKQGNGIDGSKGRVTRQTPKDLRFHGAMGDSVQVIQSVFIGKYQISQLFSL